MILFYNCNNKSDKETELQRIHIKYKNGNIYCDGFHSVLKKNGLPKNRTGIWKFYYPDGALEAIKEYNENGEHIGVWKTYYTNGKLKTMQEYDEYGKEVNYKYYFENGKLSYSEVYKNDITYTTDYDENGKIKFESVSHVVTESSDEGESETTSETYNKYYPNGQLLSKSSFEDGILQGNESFWDSTGNLVLTIEYKNGLIVTK